MKIAVVGATGLVGRKVLELLAKSKFVDKTNVTLFASSKSAGKQIEFAGLQKTIVELCKKNIKKYDYAIFCAGGKVSKQYAKYFIQKGAYVVDNSSAFRRDKTVPLVVPEINFEQIKKSKLIANPNCSTIGVSLPLFALQKKYKIKRIVISTYQAVSGAGQKGIQDLTKGTTNKFTYQICNNLIPQIDIRLKNDYTFEEDKMNFELKKILNDKTLKISTTCVRVPILNCHSESVNVEFETTPSLKIVKNLLKSMQGVIVFDDLENNIYPMPIVANGKNEVFVGRIRKDISNKNAINFFVCFDNILKGASLNAVQIVQKLIENQNI